MKLSNIFLALSSFRNRRLGGTLMAGALAIGLLLEAIPALAEPQVITDPRNNVNNVLRILNLEITDDKGTTTTYDVNFMIDTGIGVYGSNSKFTFTNAIEASNVRKQVMDTLNRHTPFPSGGGLLGDDQFFIGFQRQDIMGAPFITVVGAENLMNMQGVWKECSTGCIANGITILPVNAPFTYAVFSVAGGCPPGSGGVNPYDFNGDGKGDIVWRDSSSGDVAIWLMDGESILSTGIVAGVGSEWKVIGVGDVNGDGKSDLVWRNTSNGVVALWFMDGVNIGSTGFPGAVPLVWKSAEVSDFNCDGKSDIVWSHASSGATAVWLMNGATILSTKFLGGVELKWDIQPMAPIQ